MTATPFARIPDLCSDDDGWSLRSWFRTLKASRQQRLRATRLARRDRLRLGYRHIPQRIWDRRSALFVER